MGVAVARGRAGHLFIYPISFLASAAIALTAGASLLHPPIEAPSAVLPIGLPWLEAHFRIDEQERRLAAMPDSAAQLGQLLNAFEKVLQLHVELLQSTQALMKSNQTVIDAIKAPATRTSTVNLPSGPVTMTTHETRQ